MVKKALALAAVLLLATAGAAQAQQPYPLPTRIVVTAENPLFPGGSITVEARIFETGASVSFTIASQTVTVPPASSMALGSANTDSTGRANLVGTLPATLLPGRYTLTASGTGPDGKPATMSTPVRVVALSGPATVAGVTVERNASDTGGIKLPRSGASNTMPLTRGALGALGFGGLILMLANRRRSTKVDVSETAGV